MQIAELNLRAYGPFTNKLLSFGTGTGLHLVFGPNEAGKSSTLRALRNALFGMDDWDAHLHPADMLRVGLRIRLADGQVLDVERRKGKGLRSLIFPDSGKPVPMEEWARALPVNDAELFEQMFALDYDRLVAGGNKLAAFQGEIGQTMLAASGDLGETVKKIQAYQERAREIYAPQASSRLLNKALREFKNAETRMRSERFTSQKYKAAVARANELDQELIRISEELARAATERSRLTRLQTAAPHVQILTQAQTELHALNDAAILPQGFEKEYAAITKRRGEGAIQKRAAEKELGLVADRFAGLARQPEAASLLPQIDQLKEQTGQIQKARTDLPKREAELKEHIEQRQRLCADWKLDPERLPQITAEQRRQIDTLAKQYVSLQSKREDLPRRISALESRQRECELALASLPAVEDASTIAQILKQIPAKRQSGGETQRIRRERDVLRAALTRDLAALPLWTGTADELETIRVPLPVTVSEIQNRFTKWETLFEQAERDRQRLVKDAETAEVALLNLERQGSIPTEVELSAARMWRGLGWQAVKERWLQGLGEQSAAASTFLEGMTETLPTVFEASIMAADSIADRLRMEADRVEKKRTKIAELDRIKTRIAEQDAELDNRVRGQKVLTVEWEALWLDSKVKPRSPREMADWIEERKLLIDKLRDLRRLDDLIAEAEEEERVWRESLTQALHAVPGQSLASLVGIAQTKIDEVEAIAKRRNELNHSLRETQRDLGVELDGLRANEEWLRAWRHEWSKTIAALPLSAESDPGTAQALVGVIGDVRTATDGVSKLRYRIDAMLRDEQGYAEQVSAVARKAARPDLASIDPLLAINHLQRLVRTAYEAEVEFARLTNENERWKRGLGAADAEIGNAEAELEKLLRQGGIADAADIADAIEKNKRKAELSKSIAENKRALTQAAGGAPLDIFLNDIGAASPEARSMEVSELERRIDQLENDKAEKMREQERIQNEFRLREDASAVSDASCEKYSAAARIDLLLAEYVRNYVAAELLRKAVALYSDKHQDPLLRSAGEYFKELTCGAFSGILIEQGRNGRGLKAERQNGVRTSIERLSDGTRDQLFLALRLAYIENHCQQNESCPVIFDDILMAFDDQRAAAALRALRRLSERTQVLVFTHHLHHVRLAEEILGSAFQLHELTSEVSLAA